MNCLHCGEEFKPKSKKARFCSTKCRVASSRATPQKKAEKETDVILELINKMPRCPNEHVARPLHLSDHKCYIASCEHFYGGKK